MTIPEKLARLVDVCGDCWVDRKRAGGGNLASISTVRADGKRVTVSTRRYAVESAGLEWVPRSRYRSTCGEPACVNPDHIFPGVEAAKRAPYVDRIGYECTRDLVVRVIQLCRRGVRPSVDDKSWTKAGEFRVLPTARVIEVREKR